MGQQQPPRTCGNCGYNWTPKRAGSKYCPKCHYHLDYKPKKVKRGERAEKFIEENLTDLEIDTPQVDLPVSEQEEKAELTEPQPTTVAPNPFDDQPAGASPSNTSSVPAGPPTPYAGVPASRVTRKTGEMVGSAIGRILGIATGEKLTSQETEGLEHEMGNLAERHPELFGKTIIADIISGVVIISIVIAVVKRRTDRKKQEEAMKQGLKGMSSP